MAQSYSPAARERRIALALRLATARFGPDVVRRLAAARRPTTDRAVPSGSLGLDLATGMGGLPRGHLTEILGAPSSGKTALLAAAIAATQRADGLVALIDAEGSADAEALLGCGVDLDELIVAQPASAADALLMLTILARCGGLDLLALASVAALRDLPLDGRAGEGWREQRPHDLARALARGLRVLTVALADGPTAVVVTNETWPGYPIDQTPGGLALRHFAALRVAVEPRALLADAGGDIRALRAELTVVKHKLGAPLASATVEFLPGRGPDRAAELVALGLATGTIARLPDGLACAAGPLGPDEAAARRRLGRDGALADALLGAILAAARRSPAA